MKIRSSLSSLLVMFMCLLSCSRENPGPKKSLLSVKTAFNGLDRNYTSDVRQSPGWPNYGSDLYAESDIVTLCVDHASGDTIGFELIAGQNQNLEPQIIPLGDSSPYSFGLPGFYARGTVQFGPNPLDTSSPYFYVYMPADHYMHYRIDYTRSELEIRSNRDGNVGGIFTIQYIENTGGEETILSGEFQIRTQD